MARINPRAGAAQLQLARIHLARGDAKKAAVVAAEAARANPNDVNAAALSVRSLRTAGERDRAERELDAKLKEQPGSAVLNVEQGWLALQRQQLASARAAFGRALEADPVHREARAGLVATELARRIGQERSCARRELAGRDRRPMPQPAAPAGTGSTSCRGFRRGGTDASRRRASRRRRPSRPMSCLHAFTWRPAISTALPTSIALFTERRPSAPGPLTMIGLIHESQGDRAAAMAQYAAALARDPAAGVAANNLAWLNAEDGQLDEALRLATTARQTLGSRPGGRGHDRVGALSPRRLPRSRPVVTSRRRTGARSGQVPLPPRYGALRRQGDSCFERRGIEASVESWIVGE